MAGKKSEKRSFVMYSDWEAILGVLDDGDLGELMRAVFAYVNRGVQPEFEGAMKAVFIMIAQQLGRDEEKWESICERNRRVAEKRWADREPYGSDAKNGTAASTGNTKSTKNADTDTVIVTDTACAGEPFTANEYREAPVTTTITTTEKQKNADMNKFPFDRYKTFTPPTPAEVAAYCRERQNGIDAEYFCDYYSTKGWRTGKSMMTDWRAAVRMWERKEKSPSSREEEQRSRESSESSDFDFDAYYAFAESYDPELILGQPR